MRIIKLHEQTIECPTCKSTLAFTSKDIKSCCGGTISYISCPVCNNNIIFNYV